MISDFLGARAPDSVWLTATVRRWEVVPVVVQDPVWEQSFPQVSSLILPLVDPDSGETVEVRLSRREANEQRLTNERRRDALFAGFVHLGLEPVLLDTDDPDEIDRRFLDWAVARRDLRSRR